MMKKEKTPAVNILSWDEKFKLSCTVNEVDYVQSLLLGQYGDMLYEKRSKRIQTVIGVGIFGLLTLLLASSKEIVKEACWVTIGFGLLFLVYGIYFDLIGYKHDFVTLTRELEIAQRKNTTNFEDISYDFEFREDSVYFTDSNGITRYFLYTDIRYIEQTDRFYEIGMKYLPKETRLYDLDKVLITKRYLSDEQEDKLVDVLNKVIAEFSIEPVLEDHPFK